MLRKNIIFILLTGLVFVGCASKKKELAEGELDAEGGSKIGLIEKVNSAVSPNLTTTPPRLVAVLPPVPNEKVVTDIADWDDVDPVEIFRTVFFGRFSVLPFKDMHIREVDRILAQNQLNNPEAIKAASPSQLSELIGADALIYIDLTKAENITSGVHSRTEYAATLRMIDAKTGAELWRAELNQTSRGGLLSGKSSQVADLVAFEKQNKNKPLAFRKVAEEWSQKVIQDFKEKFGQL